jgi:hypothetical protein
MELDKFITASLNSIIKGVNNSKDFAIKNGARINPHVGKWDIEKTQTTYYGDEEGAREISKIEFDIAITTSSEKDKAGGLGVNVFSAKIGGKLSKKDIDKTLSRIKFHVSVALPNTDTNK